MPVRTLYLIRHAEVGPTYRWRYLGREDVSLSEEGKCQARQLGEQFLNRSSFLERDIPVWVSPLNRCSETWKEMRLPFKFLPEEVTELLEIDFGEWGGKTFSEIVGEFPQEVLAWSQFQPEFRFPKGESLSEFQARMERLRQKILDCSSERLILITHGGVAASLLCLILGLHPSQYLIFELARPSILTVTLFENGLGRLAGLETVRVMRGGEWPG